METIIELIKDMEPGYTIALVSLYILHTHINKKNR